MTLENHTNNNTSVSHEDEIMKTPNVINQMTIYNHPQKLSVAQLSEQHKVLLVFLRFFQCPFCQATIAKVALNYKTLIQLNTIPVFIHQETEEYAMDYFANHEPFKKFQPIVSQFLRVSDPSGRELYSQFNLGLMSRKGKL
jgi:NMD protein affecting ribosome stability and mRNA decay